MSGAPGKRCLIKSLFLIAGGVTYAVLLALFPGLAGLVSLYGLAFNAGQIEQQVAALAGVLPAQTQELLSQELHRLVQASNGRLGFAAATGLLIALWSASRGMTGLITAINLAYEERERRGFFKLNMIALGLTRVRGHWACRVGRGLANSLIWLDFVRELGRKQLK